MFIASKYEEVIPLLMRTVINKIGHNKFSLKQVEEKEIEVLKTIGYIVGAPTFKEFLDRYLAELADIIPNNEKLYKALMCIGKMTCYSYDLMQL